MNAHKSVCFTLVGLCTYLYFGKNCMQLHIYFKKRMCIDDFTFFSLNKSLPFKVLVVGVAFWQWRRGMGYINLLKRKAYAWSVLVLQTSPIVPE